jgi:3-keto-L-gulonate-6-phosphate decarboxylase
MTPHLWIAYDYVRVEECLAMLDTVLAQHSEPGIIHEIGRPTLINAALEGVPIVAEFRKRLSSGQTLVADFKGYDVPYIAEGKHYYAAGADMTTVMAMAPDEAIGEAIDGANVDGKLVAFDLMTYLDDDFKARRARELVQMGAKLLSCHTGWSEQGAGKTPEALIGRVCEELRGTGAQVIAMGGMKPNDVERLQRYVDRGQIFAIVAGSAITRSKDPNATIDHFLDELSRLQLPESQAS